MMKSFKYLFGFLTLIFVSCEKVIDVDLNEQNGKLIIDGGITNLFKNDTIKLSRTGSFFGDNNFSTVNDAEVVISDNLGNSEKLAPVSDGNYIIKSLKGTPGNSYTLSVKADNKSYSAVAKMLQPIEIDQLTYRHRERSLGAREGNYVTVWFQDPPGENNYYMIKAKAAMISNQGHEKFFVFRDEFFDGEYFGMEIPFAEFWRGKAQIELYTIDKPAYDYLYSLNELIQNPDPKPFSGVPQQPVGSNIQGEALGYFTAFAVSVGSITIE
jgi:hypothetical protein